jgi:hypothetical protein
MTEENGLKQKRRLGHKSKWHRTDLWRGYLVPPYAVAGASYTGEEPDSPALLKDVKPEIDKLRNYLVENGIKDTHINMTPSSNVFMVKLWVTAPENYETALDLANKFLAEGDQELSYLHDATGQVELKHTPTEDIQEISDEEWEKAGEGKHALVEPLEKVYLSVPIMKKAPILKIDKEKEVEEAIPDYTANIELQGIKKKRLKA